MDNRVKPAVIAVIQITFKLRIEQATTRYVSPVDKTKPSPSRRVQLVKPEVYRNSSMHSSSTWREGRVTLSGKVASGWSVMSIMSRKLGAVVFR
jgi:hypothetical protein